MEDILSNECEIDISSSEEEEFSRTNIESSRVRTNIYEDKGRGRQTLNKNQKVVHAQVHSENTDEDESHVTANEDDNKRDGSPPVSEYGKGSFEGNIKMEKEKNKKTLVENSTKSNKRTAFNAVRKKKPTSEYESDDTSNKGDESPPLSEHGKGNSRMANERNKNTPVKHSTKSYKSAAPNKGEKRTPISENEPDVRRSKRNRVRRLEYWRGETIEYKLGMDNCREVVGIIPGSPDYICSPLLQKAKRKDNITALVDKDEGSRRKLIALSHGNNVIMHECFSTFRIDPETAESDVTVLTGLEVPSMSAGLIKVAPFAVKRDLVNDESSLVSFILNGSVTVQILRTTRTLKKGEIFFVPRGVHYSIANESPKTAVITYMMYE